MERKIVLKDNIIEALLESVGAEGTIMMPTQSWKNLELIGVGFDKNTSLHLADARADYPSKHNNIEHSAVMENGHRVWKKYETLFVDGEDYEEIGAAFENVCSVHKATLGNGVIRLMKQRDLVDFAVRWIEENRK